MGTRQLNLLEMVLAGPGGSRCVVTTQDRAQACIIDLDGVGAGEELFRQRTRHPQRPLVLAAVNRPADHVVGMDVFLPKPIRVEALVAAVDVVLARLSGGPGRRRESAAPRHRVDDVVVTVPAAPVPGPVNWSADGAARPDQRPAAVVVADPHPGGHAAPVGRGDTPSATLPIVLPGGRATPPRLVAASPLAMAALPSPSPSLEFHVPAPQGVAATTRGTATVRSGTAVPARTGPSHRAGRARTTATGAATGPATGPERGPAAGSDQPDPERIRTYDPGRYLQGLVTRARQEALRRGQAVHLEGPWPTISLLPTCGTAVVAGGAAALRPFGPQYDLPSHVRPTFTPAPLFSPNHPDAVDLDALIWELAIAASAGRVPEGVTVDRPCLLRDWPNFTRLTTTSGAMGIAALWTREPATLMDTARVLQVPLTQVCTFYSAAEAIGLIVAPEGLVAAPAASASTRPSPHRGLLRRVFDKLYGAHA